MAQRIKTMGEVVARFWSRVGIAGPDDCWPHSGPPNKHGYIMGWVGGPIGKQSLVHRTAYTFAHGPIPEGYDIHHQCRNPACCNPAHLVAKTRADHILEPGHMAAVKLARTHCLRGHEYTPENTYVYRGRRNCRQCIRQRPSAHIRKRWLHPDWKHGQETHCKRGHEFTPENTRIDPKRGARHCRACERQNSQAYKVRQRAAAVNR